MSAPEAVAAMRFFAVLKLMAEDETLTPQVMLHVVGLTSALLMHYSDVTRDELLRVIDGTSADPVALEGLYLAVQALGLKIEGAPEPEPDESA